MDIMDFFWTFDLNHLSPLWGYFCFDQSATGDTRENLDFAVD